MIFCFWHIYLDAHANRKPLENAPAFYFILGSVVLEQVGAGILGFTMTFALTNVWSHGTWVTPAHGHLALFGTFGMLVIGAAYYAVPMLRRGKPGDFDQRLGRLGFWLVFAGVIGLALAFALGGTVQVYISRTLGLEWVGGDLMPAMNIYKVLVAAFGFVLTVGAGLIVYDLSTLGRETNNAVVSQPVRARSATGWSRPLTGFEAGIWLLGMWIFGFIVTFNLLSYNLDIVRVQGNPTLPYVLAGIGYPGLFLTTLLFVWRFLASMEARVAEANTVSAPATGSLAKA